MAQNPNNIDDGTLHLVSGKTLKKLLKPRKIKGTDGAIAVTEKGNDVFLDFDSVIVAAMVGADGVAGFYLVPAQETDADTEKTAAQTIKEALDITAIPEGYEEAQMRVHTPSGATYIAEVVTYLRKISA